MTRADRRLLDDLVLLRAHDPVGVPRHSRLHVVYASYAERGLCSQEWPQVGQCGRAGAVGPESDHVTCPFCWTWWKITRAGIDTIARIWPGAIRGEVY